MSLKNSNRPGRPRRGGPGPQPAGDDRQESALVSSLTKALQILTLFTFEHPDWSPSEMASATGLHRASVYRILRTMEHELFVGLDPLTGRYHLGPAMYPAAYLTQTNSELVRIAHPHVEKLARSTGETANLGVDFDGRVVIVDEVLTSHVYKPNLPTGMAIGDLRNSHAKLLLAFKSDAERRQRIEADRETGPKDREAVEVLLRELDTIRVEGVAYDLESMVGVCAISVPVFDQFGALRASLAVVAPPERFAPEQMRDCVRLAQAQATALSRDLGYAPDETKGGPAAATE